MRPLLTSFLVLLVANIAKADTIPYSARYLGSIPSYEHVSIVDAPDGSPYVLKHSVLLCPSWDECTADKRIVGSPLDEEGHWYLIKPDSMTEEHALELVLEAMQKVHTDAHLVPPR